MDEFWTELEQLKERTASPLERLLEAPVVQLPKEVFLSPALFRALFAQLPEQQEEDLRQLELKAKSAGVLTAFRAAYKKYRKEHWKQTYRLDVLQPLTLEGFPRYDLPEGYRMEEGKGILRFDYDQGGFLPVFPHPVILSQRLRDIDTGEERVEVMSWDNGRLSRLVCEAETVSNTRSITSLRRFGIRVTSENARELVAFLSEFLTVNIGAIPVVRSSRRLGWEDERCQCFLPYDKALVFGGETGQQRAFLAVRSQGELEVWKKAIAQGMDNPITRTYLMASFASPLVGALKKLPFIVHAGGGSGSGKTVALYAAASVWGKPEDMTLTFDDTKVAIERYSGMFHSLPVFINEGETKSRHMEFSDFIYQFCEGKGRGRGNKTGGVDYIETWQSVAITNAESSMLGPDSKEGAINRVIDLDCGGGMRFFPDLQGTADLVKEHYGHAGRVYLSHLEERWLTPEGRPLLREYYRLFQGLILERRDVTEKQAISAALLLLADFLAQMAVWGRGEEEARASTCCFAPKLAAMLKSPGDVDLTARAYDYIMGFVAQNRGNFITEENRYDSVPVCWGKIREGEVWIIANVLSHALSQTNYPVSKVTRELAERGLLERDPEGKPSVKKKINKTSVRCYVIQMPVP